MASLLVPATGIPFPENTGKLLSVFIVIWYILRR